MCFLESHISSCQQHLWCAQSYFSLHQSTITREMEKKLIIILILLRATTFQRNSIYVYLWRTGRAGERVNVLCDLVKWNKWSGNYWLFTSSCSWKHNHRLPLDNWKRWKDKYYLGKPAVARNNLFYLQQTVEYRISYCLLRPAFIGNLFESHFVGFFARLKYI